MTTLLPMAMRDLHRRCMFERPMKLGGRERMDDGAALEDGIAPAAWIPEVVAEGALDDNPTARGNVDLLARLYGAVVETLRSTPEIICPEPDKPAQEAVDFCRGYVHGARMHASWHDDETATAKLRPFESLASEDVDASTTTHRERLGSYVAELHAYWQSKRQVVNATPKAGRNDPCPCGSGRKHKKCCLTKQA